MTRDEVLKEFTEGLVIWEREGERQRRMADEIVRLRDRLAAVEAERDALREQLTHQTITLTAEHQRAERILATLREPSEAVMAAARADLWIPGSVVQGALRAAVAAAEREVQHGNV